PPESPPDRRCLPYRPPFLLLSHRLARRSQGSLSMKRWLAAAFAATLAACASPASGQPTPVASITEAGWKAELADVITWVASQKSTGFIIIENNRIITRSIWPVPEADRMFRNNLTHGVTPDGQTLED